MVSIVEMHIFMHSCTGFDVGYYLFLFFFGGGRELCYLAPKITSFRVKSTLAIYGLVRMTEFFFFFKVPGVVLCIVRLPRIFS